MPPPLLFLYLWYMKNLFYANLICAGPQLSHCPIMIMNEIKPEQVPIQLPSIARTLSDAKKNIEKIFLGLWR